MYRLKKKIIPKKPKLMNSPTRLEPRNVILRKNESWSIGLFPRASQRPNTTNVATPPTSNVTMVADRHPYVFASMNA